MPNRASFILAFTVAALVLGPCRTARAQLPGDSTVLYELADVSRYQEGCFDPCMCPMLTEATVTGAFTLQHTRSDGVWEEFAVDSVTWIVRFQDHVLHEVAGNGTLALDFDGHRQQLMLLLSLDGDPGQSYDSGIVAVTSEFPQIKVTVSMNGMYCYDQVFWLRAGRSSTVGIGHGTGWGAMKAYYEDSAGIH